MCDARVIQRLEHPVQQPGAFDAATAVMYQHLLGAERFDLIRSFVFGTLSENYLCRDQKLKIYHGNSSLYYVPKY